MYADPDADVAEADVDAIESDPTAAETDVDEAEDAAEEDAAAGAVAAPSLSERSTRSPQVVAVVQASPHLQLIQRAMRKSGSSTFSRRYRNKPAATEVEIMLCLKLR